MLRRLLPVAPLCLLALASAALPAQTVATRAPTRLGLLAGVNLATFGGDDAEGADTRTGFVGGGYLSLGLTPGLSLRPELLYSMKGAKQSFDEDGVSGSVEARFDYLEVPILLAFDLPVAGSIQPQLYAGPTFAFRVSCEISGSGGGITISGDCEDFVEPGEEGPRSFDAGALVGGALRFVLRGGSAFTVGARYTLGLTEIGEGADTKNRVLGIVASYEFPLGR